MKAASGDVTVLLQAWSAGDMAARDEVMDVVYRELRRRAAGQLRRERRGHTLQPTALVHEAYLRLVDQRRVEPRPVLRRGVSDDAAHPGRSRPGASHGQAIG